MVRYFGKQVDCLQHILDLGEGLEKEKNILKLELRMLGKSKIRIVERKHGK